MPRGSGLTAADRAELDLLLWELTGCWDEHRRTCQLRPCPHLQEAIEVVIAWREARLLRTQAEELRIAEVLLLFDIDLYAMYAAAVAP